MAESPNYIIFQDKELYFEVLRVLGKSLEHGSDIGECLETSWRIQQTEGSMKDVMNNWYVEWKATADRINEIGDESLSKGHNVSAREPI